MGPKANEKLLVATETANHILFPEGLLCLALKHQPSRPVYSPASLLTEGPINTSYAGDLCVQVFSLYTGLAFTHKLLGAKVAHMLFPRGRIPFSNSPEHKANGTFIWDTRQGPRPIPV